MDKCKQKTAKLLTEREASTLASYIRQEAEYNHRQHGRQERLPCPEDLDALIF